jgi:hypothetical protein
MKTNYSVSGLALILAIAPWALAISAASDSTAVAPGASCNGTCALAAADATPLVLSADAQRALLFQIDEERMAGELYTAFGAKWSLPPFANIPKAEARHESVLRQLATRAGLSLPAAVAGRFDDAEVQKRYDALLALGLESADSALRTGAYVEEVDIADLNTLITTTDSPALKDAATALKTASGHHLNAFVGALAARGITYAPQVLKADEYQASLAAGGRGMGRGRGQGMGNGQCNGLGQGQGRGYGRGNGQGWGNCPNRG